MPNFYHETTFMDSVMLGKGQKEFRINLHHNLRYCRAYNDNTHDSLWKRIERHVLDKWKDAILGHDFDREHAGTYLWIHVHGENTSILGIINDLNEWFDSELGVNMMPKLITIITRKIEDDNRFFAIDCFPKQTW
jgi:hypothetical protein